MDRPLPTESPVTRRSSDRLLYGGVGAAIAAVAFLGFARTYFLKPFFGTPALPPLVHLHGILMTLWIVFFIVQTRLVAARRVDLHRRLGMTGAGLAALIVGVGVATSIDAARRGVTAGPPPLVFLILPLSVVVVFALFVAAAILRRRRSDIHKRLMALASVSILTPAIARIPLDFVQAGGPPLFFGLTDLLVLACIAYDTARNRRLHPAFGWGALFFLASQPLRLLLATTPGWMRFATWLVG
jgi:hypothetical protein